MPSRVYTLPASIKEGARVTVDSNYRGLEVGTITLIEPTEQGTTIEYKKDNGDEYWCYLEQIKSVEATL